MESDGDFSLVAQLGLMGLFGWLACLACLVFPERGFMQQADVITMPDFDQLLLVMPVDLELPSDRFTLASKISYLQ